MCPVVQMRNLRPREVKFLSKNHPASKEPNLGNQSDPWAVFTKLNLFTLYFFSSTWIPADGESDKDL